jgi:hypothetical protein
MTTGGANMPRYKPKNRPKEIMEARYTEIAELLINGGFQNLDIVGHVRALENDPNSVWYVPEGEQPLAYWSLRRYVQKTEKRLARDISRDREKLVVRHLGQRQNLYKKALKNGDLKIAAEMLDAEERLLARLGIFPSESVPQITGNPVVLNITEQVISSREQILKLEQSREPTTLIENSAASSGTA